MRSSALPGPCRVQCRDNVASVHVDRLHQGREGGKFTVPSEVETVGTVLAAYITALLVLSFLLTRQGLQEQARGQTDPRQAHPHTLPLSGAST